MHQALVCDPSRNQAEYSIKLIRILFTMAVYKSQEMFLTSLILGVEEKSNSIFLFSSYPFFPPSLPATHKALSL